jgi:integrase
MTSWLNTYKKSSVAPSTYDSIEDCIENRIKSYDLATYQMNQLSMEILQNHINTLVEKGYSRATIKKTYDILNNCFKKATQKGDISENPMGGVEMPSERMVKTKVKKIQFYPISDIEKIVKDAKRTYKTGKPIYQHGDTILLMLFTGIRIGECIGLKWRNVDFDNKRIHIENNIIRIKNRNAKENDNQTLYMDSDVKSRSSNRYIPLSKIAYEALQSLYNKNKGFNSPENYVVQSQLHNMASERNIRRTLHAIEGNAKTSIRGAGLHVLRHSFASYMIYKGIDIVTLSRLLGHSKPSITMDIYVDIIEEQKINAINLFNDFEM